MIVNISCFLYRYDTFRTCDPETSFSVMYKIRSFTTSQTSNYFLNYFYYTRSIKNDFEITLWLKFEFPKNVSVIFQWHKLLYTCDAKRHFSACLCSSAARTGNSVSVSSVSVRVCVFGTVVLLQKNNEH